MLEDGKNEILIDEKTDDKTTADKTKSPSLRNYFFVVVLLITLLIWFFLQKDINETIRAIKNLNYFWFFMAFIAIFLYMTFTSISLDIMLRKNNQKISFKRSILLGNIAHFYNGVTPFAAGGQVFQMHYYRKFGVSSSAATVALVMNFIVYQLSITIFSLVAIIIYYNTIKVNVPDFYIFFLIGFILNTFILVILFLASYSKRAKKALFKFIMLIAKIKFFGKFINKHEERLKRYLDEFHKCSFLLIKDVKLIVSAVFVQLLALVCYFIIPFLIFRALGMELGIEKLFFTMGMISFAVVFMAYIPTPGASLGAEFAFTKLFKGMDYVTAATLLWRLISYYFLMLISLVSLFILRRRKR